PTGAVRTRSRRQGTRLLDCAGLIGGYVYHCPECSTVLHPAEGNTREDNPRSVATQHTPVRLSRLRAAIYPLATGVREPRAGPAVVPPGCQRQDAVDAQPAGILACQTE